MRRLVAAIVVAALAFALAGCGGGGSDAEAATTTTPPANSGSTPPPPPTAPTQGEDHSPVESEPGAKEPFPDLKDSLPEEIKIRLDARQPMLLFFYDPSQPNTDDTRADVDAVLKEYRGLVDLLTYDVAAALSDKYRSEEPTRAEQVSVLTSNLGVRSTPYIIITDKKSQISYRARGFIDDGLLEREVLRATQ